MIAPNVAPWTWINDCGVPWPGDPAELAEAVRQKPRAGFPAN